MLTGSKVSATARPGGTDGVPFVQVPAGAGYRGRGTPPRLHLHVVAEVTAKLGHEHQLWTQLCVLAARSRRRAGNVKFEILRDIGDPGHFLICQSWTSREHFSRYLDAASVIEHTTQIHALAQIPLQMTVCQMSPEATGPDPGWPAQSLPAPAHTAYPPGASSPPP